MIKESLLKINESNLIKQYDFVKTKYKGLDVYLKVGKGYFYQERTPKRKIVLHYTAGSLVGDIPILTNPNKKVSVSFIISLKGTIFMLYNPDYWSYHLGPNALGGNEKMSRESIGIEISSFGWLIKHKDILYTYPTKQGLKLGSPYCSIKDTHLYSKTKSFRGYEYWCNFTEEQYTSVKNLIQVLSLNYRIPLLTLPDKLSYSNKVINHKGITGHCQFRKDKWDPGPNLNFNRLLEGILS